MMRAIQIITTTIGLFIITSGVNTSFAKQSNVSQGTTSSLFSGPSGTGKTFIGETEKSLSKLISKNKKK